MNARFSITRLFVHTAMAAVLYAHFFISLSGIAFAQQACSEKQYRDLSVATLSCAPEATGACGTTSLAGSDNMEKVWIYLTGKGLQPYMAAGIMGNMQAEAHFEPRLVEYGWPNSRGEISKAGEPSSFDDVVPPEVGPQGQPGYGLVQWTSPGRKQGLRDMVASREVLASDLGTQLDYLWQELNSDYYKRVALDPILASSTLEEASDIFLEKFEVPGDIPGQRPIRRQFARDILALYESTTPTTSTAPVSYSGGSSCDIGLTGVVCPDTLEAHPTRSGYFKLPDAPNGEYTIYSTQEQRYGSKQLVCVLYSVGLAFNEAMAGRSKLRIGDLNASGHKSHNMGTAVDLSGEGELQVASHTKPWKGIYDKDATILLGKLFADTGVLRNIWWCDPGDDSTEQILAYAETKGLEGQIKCIDGHSDHFHVDIYAEYRLEHWEP